MGTPLRDRNERAMLAMLMTSTATARDPVKISCSSEESGRLRWSCSARRSPSFLRFDPHVSSSAHRLSMAARIQRGQRAADGNVRRLRWPRWPSYKSMNRGRKPELSNSEGKQDQTSRTDSLSSTSYSLFFSLVGFLNVHIQMFGITKTPS